MKAIDLFAGWGGFTEGATAVGVNVIWAGNHWPIAVATHHHNHPDTVHVCQDLKQADWTALPDYDLLLASPACPGHSTASQPRRRAYHDTSRSTAWAVIDCAEVTRPAGIVVENVPQFRNWSLYPLWRTALETLGYTITEQIVTATAHGVPQRRHRLFVTATLNGTRTVLAASTGDEPAFEPCLDSTVADTAWKPVSAATVGVQGRVTRGRARHGDRFLIQQTTGHSGIALTEPIRTITTAAQHWNLVQGDRYRALTPRELARGMGFADTFGWDTALPIADVTRGLGNAVCPPVAAAVVSAIADTMTL